MKTIDINVAKTAELVTFWNEHCGVLLKEPVAKFASRAAAEKRVSVLLVALRAVASDPAEAEPKEVPQQFTAECCCPVCGSAEVFMGEAPQGVVVREDEVRGCHDCGWFVDDKADRVKNEKRAAGVAKSWLDEAVKAARSERHAVEVDGVQYRSVREAFKALGLPDNKHIRFRGELKKAGEGVFEGHDFRLVQE